MSFRGREYSRYSLFEEVEKQELKPLPLKQYEIKSYAKGTVHKNNHIYFSKDKHGKKSTIIASQLPVEAWHEIMGRTDHCRCYFRLLGTHRT